MRSVRSAIALEKNPFEQTPFRSKRNAVEEPLNSVIAAGVTRISGRRGRLRGRLRNRVCRHTICGRRRGCDILHASLAFGANFPRNSACYSAVSATRCRVRCTLPAAQHCGTYVPPRGISPETVECLVISLLFARRFRLCTPNGAEGITEKEVYPAAPKGSHP